MYATGGVVTSLDHAERGPGPFVTKWLQLEAVDATARSTNGRTADEGGRSTLTLVASVETEDRAGDLIEAAGWELDAYARNPVVLWAHDYLRPPIGRSLRTWVEGRSLMATVEFAPLPFAQEVKALYAGGFMRGVSVGFRALESESRSDTLAGSGRQADRRRGVLYKRQELLEISAAPVPLNAMALAVDRSDGAASRRHPESRHVGIAVPVEGRAAGQWEADDRERTEIATMLREIGGLWRELGA